MMKPLSICWLALAAALLAAVAPACAGSGVTETWRLVAVRPAPWAAAAVARDPAVGGLWRLQGNSLRVSGLPLLTQRLSCDNAGFDLYHIAPGRALTALDGQVLTLQRDAWDGSPQAVAAALLQQHFGDDMAFTPASVEAKAAWLGARLRRRLAAWWALPTDPDEVPAINGDPFTNSQEYPDAFELGTPSLRGARASVPVRFSGEGRVWTVTLLLAREQGQWRITDLRYADGTRLSGWLRPPLLTARPR